MTVYNNFGFVLSQSICVSFKENVDNREGKDPVESYDHI